jgi:NAD(P)-dependent dehydrogenase (short-subunit alcohol dehydrogenase family)
VNTAGTLFCMQAAARQMIAPGTGGKIINMASQAGRRGESLVAVYCATKAAVISLTQSAGLNLIQHGINVNAIAPGVVDGEHWDVVDAHLRKIRGPGKPGEKKKDRRRKRADRSHGAVASDLTGMAIFLATPEAEIHRRPDASAWTAATGWPDKILAFGVRHGPIRDPSSL